MFAAKEEISTSEIVRQGGSTPMFTVLQSSSSVKVHCQAKIGLTFAKKIVLDFCPISCTKSILDLWPTKILPWLLTFALTEDEDQSTGYNGVPSFVRGAPEICNLPIVKLTGTSSGGPNPRSAYASLDCRQLFSPFTSTNSQLIKSNSTCLLWAIRVIVPSHFKAPSVTCFWSS